MFFFFFFDFTYIPEHVSTTKAGRPWPLHEKRRGNLGGKTKRRVRRRCELVPGPLKGDRLGHDWLVGLQA